MVRAPGFLVGGDSRVVVGKALSVGKWQGVGDLPRSDALERERRRTGVREMRDERGVDGIWSREAPRP